jgi:hypothetical protein
VWDKVLGTYDDPGVITVPRRMAPVWMLDADGEVRLELAGDYVAKGRRKVGGSEDRTQSELDRVDAFANATPRA